MSDSRDTRIEQAVCFGHSHAWILTHIGGTVADITRAIERMDAADRGDNAAWRAALSDEDRRKTARGDKRTGVRCGTMNEPPRCANTATALTTVPASPETRL